MVKEYELVNLKKSDFQDNFGNYWVDVAFKGVGEPVKWVVKDPTKLTEGETYRGEIKELTSKAGKPYLRFYRESVQDAPQAAPAAQTASTPSKPDEAYWQSKNDHIKAQWAIGQAIIVTKCGASEEIEAAAKDLFAMVDRVAGSTSVVEEQPKTGYEKAKAVAAKIADKEEDEEIKSLLESERELQPIDISDVPF